MKEKINDTLKSLKDKVNKALSNDKTKKIITYTCACLGALLLIIACIIGIIKITKGKYQNLNELEKLMYALSNLSTYESFEINNERNIFAEYGTNDEDVSKMSIKTNIKKKDNNYKVEASFNASGNEEYFGGLYFNKERLELITTKEESIFVKYPDIFKVIKTMFPALKDVASDFQKINYKKYINIAMKDISDINKKALLKRYIDIIKEGLDGKVTRLEDEDILNGDLAVLCEKYNIKMSARSEIELKIKLLRELKKDEEVRKNITNIADDLFNNLSKDEEYKKIRMKEEEFNNIKFKYGTDVLKIFDEIIDKQIEKLKQEYNRVSEDKEITFDYYLTKEGRIARVNSYGIFFNKNGALYIKDEIDIINVNDVKNKMIVPNVSMRINLADRDRAGIYKIVEIITTQYKSFYKNIMIDINEGLK